MSEWISVKDCLPPEEEKMNTLWFDVWCGHRETDVKFRDGVFELQVEDADGDYSHDVTLDDVTHWMHKPMPPEAT